MAHIVQNILGSLKNGVGLSGWMSFYSPSYQYNCTGILVAHNIPEGITSRALSAFQEPIHHNFQLHTYSFSHCALIVLPIFIIIFIICFSFLNKLISCSKVQIPEFASSFIFRRIWLYVSKKKKKITLVMYWRLVATFKVPASAKTSILTQFWKFYYKF